MREIYRWGCETRYPNLSLQSGPDNIGWGAPRWALRAEPPRVLERGDLVQAEIHTLYGGHEAQVQMCVALDPIDDVLARCERVAAERLRGRRRRGAAGRHVRAGRRGDGSAAPARGLLGQDAARAHDVVRRDRLYARSTASSSPERPRRAVEGSDHGRRAPRRARLALPGWRSSSNRTPRLACSGSTSAAASS